MSSPLAIAAVSAVLRNLLDSGMVEVAPPVGSVDVTAVAPDTIELATGNLSPSLNLFLYRVTPNIGWRNVGLPSRTTSGRRSDNPPLALDLHYLLTAYGHEDFEAEILLGYAMHLLHERPVLDRPAIRRALQSGAVGASLLPPAFQALSASDLADQVEAVTVTPEPIDSEEMSRLWAAIQSHYRPSVGYLVSVVLIEATEPASSALPVLSRGDVDLATGREAGAVVTPGLVPPYPTIDRVASPSGHPSALLGDTMRIAGHHLAGTSVTVTFGHRLLTDDIELGVADNDDPAGLDVVLPNDAPAQVAWPAGLWTVTVTLTPPGEPRPRTTNVAALALAPVPALPPSSLARDPVTDEVEVTLAVTPEVRPAQRATLALGTALAVADPHPTATSNLDFTLVDVPGGPQWVRLSVDGVDSHLVDHAVSPPVFDGTQSVVVP